MVKKSRANNDKPIQAYKDALGRAQQHGDNQAIITALVDLGFAHIQKSETEEGETRFAEAVELAEKIQNIELQVKCLGLKALAYQEADRLHTAYQTINEILDIAAQRSDEGMKCDALVTQGQILVDSGEPIIALQKLEEAQKIADEMGDRRRQMNVLGVLGNQSIAVASLTQAEAYFDKAAKLADELDDPQAKFGYLGNKGSVLVWQGNYKYAIPEFEKVLDFVHGQENQKAEIQALRHLAQAHSRLKQNEKALEYSLRGVELCKMNDEETILSFYETVIVTYYRQGMIKEAQSTNQDAVEFARALNNKARELDFLLGLGESQFLSELYEDALKTYQQALDMAKLLNRKTDEAYLVGRMGVTLAELGRLDDAIECHSQAVELARLWLLPNLEGEQLSMLAMAHLEKGEIQLARKFCNSALQVFAEAGLKDEVQKVNQLREKINA